ncbi:hypothetical protein [Bartonella quintana]|uniref:hypothetical protein n=1 Tax=Bartonella quintana TaxID=803 RepID=UPI000DA37467|nr:hypothetical protein [Bartonella quintana]SQF95204.1 Uncharacterised protein [Bartonella quintana]
MKSEWIGGNIPFVERSIYKKGVLLAEVFHQYSAAISKRLPFTDGKSLRMGVSTENLTRFFVESIHFILKARSQG